VGSQQRHEQKQLLNTQLPIIFFRRKLKNFPTSRRKLKNFPTSRRKLKNFPTSRRKLKNFPTSRTKTIITVLFMLWFDWFLSQLSDNIFPKKSTEHSKREKNNIKTCAGARIYAISVQMLRAKKSRYLSCIYKNQKPTPNARARKERSIY
jgi:hypothetical protein